MNTLISTQDQSTLHQPENRQTFPNITALHCLTIEEGIDILNPVQPECNDLQKIYDQFGHRLAFWGGIGTQSTMPFGTPDEVREAVRNVQQTLGGLGALVIAPSHILEPEVPWENVLAFIEAAKASYYETT